MLFSFERARGPGSNITAYFASVKEARVVSPSVIEFETHRPNPIFLEEITGWGIMSRAWAERNNAQRTAERIVSEAETEAKAKLVQARDETLKLRNQAEQEFKQREREFRQEEDRLQRRRVSLPDLKCASGPAPASSPIPLRRVNSRKPAPRHEGCCVRLNLETAVDRSLTFVK